MEDGRAGFAELAARSHYSFREGSASPEQLVAAAADCDIGALGLCDRNGLYGAVAFTQAAQRAGIRPVLGAELDLIDGTRLRLLARDRTGYRQLSRAISAAQLAGEKGQPLLTISGLDLVDTRPACDPAAAAAPSGAPDMAGARPSSEPRRRRRITLEAPERPAALRPTAGPFPQGWPGLPSTVLLAGGPAAVVDPADLSGCIVLAGGPHSALTEALLAGDRRGATRRAGRLREAFGRDRVALLLTHHLHPADSWLAAETAALARRCGLPLLASSTPVQAGREDKPLHDVLTAIRHRCTLDDAAAHGLLLPNSEHRMRSEQELRLLLSEYPEAFDHTAHIAQQCAVSLDFSDVRFPGFAVPEGETPFSMLYALCHAGLPQRYHPITQQVAARLQRELDVIERTGLAEFFLICWDLMRYAREQGIPGQGRGSAADSIVAYLLGITRVDPIEHNLLFERFLHEDHQGTPDIDIDFSTDHREQLLQYVYDRYGAERTGMVANIITYRPRLAVRDVGRALGFPQTIIDRLARSVDGYYWDGFDAALELSGIEVRGAGGDIQEAALPWQHYLRMVGEIIGTPRHLGIHVGGMLVTGEPLVDVAPVERASMPGRVVVQFNKDDVEDLGLIKMDLLGLRTLSAIAECLQWIERSSGVRPDLDRLPLDDEQVYDTICVPDTIGMFQIESRAQQQSLYQSQPRCFNDLIVQVAIIRPGPIQGDAVHPYLRRRQGLEPVTYLHPSLEPILSETRGVILYQEQILRIVMEVAGYTAGQADRFRRAMNRHRSRVEMETLRDEFVRRCMAHGGTDEATAALIFRSAAGFAQFGFCKSHAAAFARTAYETAWLRLHHFAAWLCSLLNAQPMGFYHPSVLVEDAKRHGVRTLPVDVTRSRARCTVEWVGDTAPPSAAVRAGMAPGWRIADRDGDGDMGVQGRGSRVGEAGGNRGRDGAVVREATTRAWTRAEREAERAVHLACAAAGGQVRVDDGGAKQLPRDGRAGEQPRVEDRATLRALRESQQPCSSSLGGPESPWAVRLGFNYVAALGPVGRAACDAAVEDGATESLEAFWQHTLLQRPVMENLVMVGAFDGMTGDRPRRALLWELKRIEESLPPRRRIEAESVASVRGTELPLEDEDDDADVARRSDEDADIARRSDEEAALARRSDDDADLARRSRGDADVPRPVRAVPPRPGGRVAPPRGRGHIADLTALAPRNLNGDPAPPLLEVDATAPQLPELDERARNASQYRISELTTGPHLLAHLRDRLDRLGCVPLAAVVGRPNGSRLRVAGLVIARQAPMSAKGFRFFTLADEGAHLDLVFRPRVAERTRAVANFHPLLVVDGTLEVEHGRVNLVVERVRALDADGNLLTAAAARLGANAADAPRTQHGHIPAAPVDLPPSHDYH